MIRLQHEIKRKFNELKRCQIVNEVFAVFPNGNDHLIHFDEIVLQMHQPYQKSMLADQSLGSTWHLAHFDNDIQDDRLGVWFDQRTIVIGHQHLWNESLLQYGEI